MEKHKCKLCFKSYANGRALGGHMRSHMMNLPIQSKPEQPSLLSNEADSSSYEDEDEDEDEHAKGLLIYGLRENPKKSFRLADPEFAFAVASPSSVVLQDRESEAESSKNPTRLRSTRTRTLNHYHHQEDARIKKIKFNKLDQDESWAEPEAVSSVSDATTEEDVAFCLMMLSRDNWIKNQIDEREGEQQQEREGEIEKLVENSYESDETKLSRIIRNRGGKYKCETCSRVFKSYQALGGHRASHKKMRVTTTPTTFPEMELENGGKTSTSMADRKIHECPVCYRVFSSGQALGGHKRSHAIGSATTPIKNSAKSGEVLIDLNLPAPVDDDQVELSAVSN